MNLYSVRYARDGSVAREVERGRPAVDRVGEDRESRADRPGGERQCAPGVHPRGGRRHQRQGPQGRGHETSREDGANQKTTRQGQ